MIVLVVRTYEGVLAYDYVCTYVHFCVAMIYLGASARERDTTLCERPFSDAQCSELTALLNWAHKNGKHIRILSTHRMTRARRYVVRVIC